MIDFLAAYGGLKTAYDIAKGLNATDTQVKINDVKIALQQHILDARDALSAASDTQAASASRTAELEQEIVRIKDWSAQRKRYELINVRHGAIAYAPKRGMEYGEPSHWLCANCFDQTKKSFLQNKGTVGPEATYGCDTCKGSFKAPFRYNPESLARQAAGTPVADFVGMLINPDALKDI